MTAEPPVPIAPYGAPSRSDSASRKPLTLHRLRALREAGEKVTMLTAYDAASASLLDAAGVDCLLVGDSLGMVMQGHASTLPVTLEQMVYHTQCVARGNRTAWLIADLPFGSYHGNTDQAVASSVALMQAGAQMIKLEGGGWFASCYGGKASGSASDAAPAADAAPAKADAAPAKAEAAASGSGGGSKAATA